MRSKLSRLTLFYYILHKDGMILQRNKGKAKNSKRRPNLYATWQFMGCERICLWHEFRNARIPSSVVLVSMSEGTICDKFGHPVPWANQQESKRRFQICFDSAVRFNSGQVSPQKLLQLNQTLTDTYSTDCLMI